MNNPDIEALLKIDALDVRAAKLRREIADLPSDLNKAKARQKAALDRVHKCQDEVKRLEREIQKIAGDTAANNEQVKKLQTQQNTVKTNDEYAALKKQIEAVKKANGDLDDKALAHYEEIDKLKAEEKELKAQLAEAEGKLKADEAEVGKEIAGLQEDLGKVVAAIKEAEGKTTPAALTLYRRILDKVKNRAMAAVRGRTCQGCFIEIPPNSLSMLLSGKEVVQCKQCARILYLEQDYRAVSTTSYLVTERDRGDDTSKDGNW